jgi:hypothetical protein
MDAGSGEEPDICFSLRLVRENVTRKKKGI